MANDAPVVQAAPVARKRIYWFVPIVLSILAAVAAYMTVLEDAKADLHANRLEAQVQEYLSNPPQEVFPNHEENRNRAKADRERQEFINRKLGIEPEAAKDEDNPYHEVLDRARARELEAIRQHREVSRFILSVVERDEEGLDGRLSLGTRRAILTSDQTRHLFREPKLEEYLDGRSLVALPIAGAVAGVIWGMAISWAATYPNLGWRRLSISLAALGILGAVCYPSDRASSLDRLGAAVGLAVVTPLVVLIGREVVLWIVRGFVSKSAVPPAQ